MINRRPIGANDASGNAAADDDLTRLVRAIARQAAREAIKAFTEALDRPVGPGRSLSGPSIPPGACAERAISDAGQTKGSNERYFSVAQVADQLGLSEKSVRRKIAKGELPAHRMGKLLRIGDSGLAAYRARTRLSKRQT